MPRLVRILSLAPFPLIAFVAAGARADRPPRELAMDVTQWRVVERESGHDNYYTAFHDPGIAFVRAEYRPPMETTVLGCKLPDDVRSTARTMRWKWRALTLPRGGNECDEHKADSAAVVYLTWKRALRWYTIKYVWSSVGPKGAICARKRNPFMAQDTVILESGGPLGAWKGEQIDLRAEFRAHFEDGKADADVPAFVGVGIMTDGDQTQSESAADYADFVLTW